MEPSKAVKLNNFITYELDDGTRRSRMGHFDQEKGTITPLAFESGTPIHNLYQIIAVGEDHVIASGEPFPATEKVSIRSPIGDRDVIAVGMNYGDHVREVSDSAEKPEIPSCPRVFTKRATSIIANEEDILLHEGFTEQLDYEGEIGVIIGKGGFQISEADAPNHVWGYTIVNDVSARDRQEAHGQVYIGKNFGIEYIVMS